MGKREWTSVVLAMALAACAGDTAEEQPPADTSAAPAPAPAAPAAGALPEGVTAAMVAEGKTIFETTICFTCHGMDGSGQQGLGPNLRDAEWLNTDGSYDGIMNTVRAGVPTPKQHPAMMPPMGGAQLTEDQLRAVSAYVYSISHGG